MPVSDAAEALRFAIYHHLARDGALPSHDVLAAGLGMDEGGYRAALGELTEARHVVLRDGEVDMAHPFATRSFGFSVMSEHTLWWGGCAWDAFAIPHLVPGAREVLVATTCPACMTPHAWNVEAARAPQGAQVAHFLVPMDQVWPDAAHACEHQRIFCSPDCVRDWLSSTGHASGHVMDLTTLWRLAAHWYDGRLGTPYERREPAAAADYFGAVGLHGRFWVG